jgi:hypothetical protein
LVRARHDSEWANAGEPAIFSQEILVRMVAVLKRDQYAIDGRIGAMQMAVQMR